MDLVTQILESESFKGWFTIYCEPHINTGIDILKLKKMYN